MFDFDHLPLAKFNPMRDVWFPLDLSNAASFNAVMAQSAAHLSRMQGHPKSAEALKFKAEAIRIISLWMADETLALGDDVVAAVSRILTYEASSLNYSRSISGSILLTLFAEVLGYRGRVAGSPRGPAANGRCSGWNCVPPRQLEIRIDSLSVSIRFVDCLTSSNSPPLDLIRKKKKGFLLTRQ